MNPLKTHSVSVMVVMVVAGTVVVEGTVAEDVINTLLVDV